MVDVCQIVKITKLKKVLTEVITIIYIGEGIKEYIPNRLFSLVNHTKNQSSQIRNNTIYFNFKNLNNETIKLDIPFDTYKEYILHKLRPITYKPINISGEIYYILNSNLFLTPNIFKDCILDLTNDRVDKEFVREVINFKNQIIYYHTFWDINCRWPIESLVEGVGDCEDTSVLVVSMLKAGNEIENYGMKVSLFACDIYNITNPNTVNHVIIHVEYSDGTYDLIEPTAKDFYTYEKVAGWEI